MLGGPGEEKLSAPVVSRQTFPGPGRACGISISSSLMQATFVFPLGETVWELLRPEVPPNRRSLLPCRSGS